MVRMVPAILNLIILGKCMKNHELFIGIASGAVVAK
jgi:hypothetical protein